jgi:hypothetical protein
MKIMKALINIILQHKAAILIFIFLVCIHFWYVILHINSALYGGPGDHTAGLIWLYDQYSQTPWWQTTEMAAFPWGEKLWSPLFIMGQVGYVTFWACSKIMDSSVGGYNLFTGIAFTLSFVVSYLFIYKRFFQISLVSALLAAVITFTPMAMLLNEVGHASYLFMPAYLLGAMWCIFKIFETSNFLPAIILGVIGGLTIIFDPYFILFIPLASVSLIGALMINGYHKKFNSTMKSILLRLLLATAVSLVFIAPVLLYVNSQASEVAAISTSSRGSQVLDATLYSARIEDYILPSVDNPISPVVVDGIKAATYHGKDPTFTLYLGWSLIFTTAIACVWWLRNRNVISLDAKILRITGLSFLAVAAVAFIFSLPPIIKIAQIDIYTPTWVLATLTPVWRVFARLYFVIQPAMILACIAWFCEYMLHVPSNRQKALIFGWISIFCVLLMVEYLPRNPFEVKSFWSYEHSLPSVYNKIANSKSDNIIAEYPMREQPYYRASLYSAGQHIHMKPTINAYSPVSPTAYSRTALMDLDNPQTIPALRYLGATTLVVWNNGLQQWTASNDDGLTRAHSEDYDSKFGAGEVINSYVIRPGSTRRYVAVVQSGYRPDDEGRIYNIAIPVESGLSLAVVDLCKDFHQECSQTVAPLKLKMEVYNKSDKTLKVALKSIGVDDDKILNLHKGKNLVDIQIRSERYVMEFDKSFNDLIRIKNQEIVQ